MRHRRLGMRSLVVAGAVLLGLVSASAEPRRGVASHAGEPIDPLEGWWQVRSGDQELFTNASPERGAEILLRLGYFRAVFTRLAPEIEQRSPVPLRIIAFRDAAAYASYKNGRDRGGVRILGQFVRSREDAFITLNAAADGSGGRDGLAVAYHESVHDLIAHNFPAVPRWLDEGLAEYYGAFRIEGPLTAAGARAAGARGMAEGMAEWPNSAGAATAAGARGMAEWPNSAGARGVEEPVAGGARGVEEPVAGGARGRAEGPNSVGARGMVEGRNRIDPSEAPATVARIGLPVERHLDWLQRDRNLALREVVAERDLHGGRSSRVGRFYAVSWALVHYLLSSPEDTGRLGDFLVRLLDGEDPERALPAAMGRSLDRLEEELESYLLAGRFATLSVPVEQLPAPSAVEARPLPRAEIATHLGDLLALSNRREEAAEHFELALSAGSDLAEGWSGLAWLQDLVGSHQEAEVLHRKALALQPRRAATWLRWGRNRSAVGDWNAARAAFAEALVLDPGFAEARAFLGRVHGRPGGDPKSGARHLERAIAALPYRMDLVVDLVRVLLADRRPDEAERWVEGMLARFGEGEQVDGARQDIQRARELLAAEEAFAVGDAEAGLAAFDRAVSATRDGPLRQAMEERLRDLQRRYRP
ncbi:MAG: tetratricopeptide repeat protein [Acidobacteriota bacterium]